MCVVPFSGVVVAVFPIVALNLNGASKYNLDKY